MTSAPKHPDPQLAEPGQDEPLHNPSGIQLRSLAPGYVQDHHETYVQHLQNAVGEVRVLNIALTGRYGSGKSSILDKFEQDQRSHGKSVVRISITTLGPDTKEGITNRIQKELVKQLVYRAEPGQLRSKYGRAKKQPWWQDDHPSTGEDHVARAAHARHGPDPHAVPQAPPMQLTAQGHLRCRVPPSGPRHAAAHGRGYFTVGFHPMTVPMAPIGSDLLVIHAGGASQWEAS